MDADEFGSVLELWSIDRVLQLDSVDDCPDSSCVGYWVDDDLANDINERWDDSLTGRAMMEQILDNKRLDSEYNELVASMRRRGITSPLGVSYDTLHNGHHRLAAMLDLGYTEVPVVVNDDGWAAWESSENDLGWGQLMPPPDRPQ